LKILFFRLYLAVVLADYNKIWSGDEELHVAVGHVIKTAIFDNSRWRTAAILKIAVSSYLSHALSVSDQIWYVDADIFLATSISAN